MDVLMGKTGEKNFQVLSTDFFGRLPRILPCWWPFALVTGEVGYVSKQHFRMKGKDPSHEGSGEF